MKCARCDADSVTKTRGEHFCAECFHEFILRKVRATMGHFRVFRSTSEAPPLLLVCLSFGASSLALVDLLIDLQRAQREKHSGMVGFTLKCISFGTHGFQGEWPWPQIELKQLPEPQLPTEESNKKYSRSSQHDIQGVLLRRAGLALAVQQGATAVFGYSMTKLSELTLAETVKGRGSSIPALITPDIEKDHAIYPLREITIPELQEYCRIRNLSRYVRADPVVPGITKMQSIDEIVREYFYNVRKGFPSVVSTVSKVASRLSQPAEPCALCQPSQLNPTSTSISNELCYACSSALCEPRLSEPLSIAQQYEL